MVWPRRVVDTRRDSIVAMPPSLEQPAPRFEDGIVSRWRAMADDNAPQGVGKFASKAISERRPINIAAAVMLKTGTSETFVDCPGGQVLAIGFSPKGELLGTTFGVLLVVADARNQGQRKTINVRLWFD